MSFPTLKSYLDTKLAALQALAPNWDGDGGVPVTRQAAGAMLQALAIVTQAETVFPYLVPMSDGGVLAEWHAGPAKLEIEVDASGNNVVFFSIGNDERSLPTPAQFRESLQSLTAQVKRENPDWRNSFQ